MTTGKLIVLFCAEMVFIQALIPDLFWLLRWRGEDEVEYVKDIQILSAIDGLIVIHISVSHLYTFDRAL